MRTFEQMKFAFSMPQVHELRRRPLAPARLGTRLAPLDDPVNDDSGRLRLERRISAHLPGGRLELAITDNRHTMIAVKRAKGPVYQVRLHHMFLSADPTMVRALGKYVAANDAGASRELSQFIDDHQQQIRRPRPRLVAEPLLTTRGDIFDLQQVFDDLNARYFDKKIDARITWGPRNARRRARNSIKMGSYAVEDRLIRIHPALDRFFVPRYFLEWIVYHEMLHQVHAIPVVAGRRQFHTPAFLAEERSFDQYEHARLWERRNLDRILEY